MAKSKVDKVFCRDCVYRSSWMLGGNETYCRHESSKVERYTPLEIVYELKTVEQCNANNDCKLYEKDRKPEIIAAFRAIEDKNALDGFTLAWRGEYQISQYYMMPNGTDFIEVYQGRVWVISKDAYIKAKENSLRDQLKRCQEKNAEQDAKQSVVAKDKPASWVDIWKRASDELQP